MKSLLELMQGCGIIVRHQLIPDGVIHRLPTEDRPNQKNGAYLLSPSGTFGGYMNWKVHSGWMKWSSADPNDKQAAQENLRIMRQIHIDRERIAKEAAKYSTSKWGEGVGAPHGYLDRKGINQVGTRVLGDSLMVPVRTSLGLLSSLQWVSPVGDKKFVKGGVVRGCACKLRGPDDDVIYMAEGFATASTVYMASGGKTTFAAFNCGNLLPVAREVRRAHPKSRIIFAADNDVGTAGNPGVTQATCAARSVQGRIAIPTGLKGTDFNDMLLEVGMYEVRRQLREHQTV
jgi:putative DNA primase/helicase